MAHHPHTMVSCLFFQPAHTLAAHSELPHCVDHFYDADQHHGAHRIVAWGDLEFSALGNVAWPGTFHPKPLERLHAHANRIPTAHTYAKNPEWGRHFFDLSLCFSWLVVLY